MFSSDIMNPEREDGRDHDDLRDEDLDENRSVDSDQADAMDKLGPLDDEDPMNDKVGDILEITHDGKVTKEILTIGEGSRLKQGYKTFIKYKAYFFKDHLIFDQSLQPVIFCLGDVSWPDGVSTGVEKMRKGEIAKIRIGKKHGFGRPLKQDLLKYPKGYDENPEKKNRLQQEKIIYEVELIDFIERVDIEGDGNLMKYYIQKPEKNEWETPNDKDEINFDIKIFQKRSDESEMSLWEKQNWEANMLDNSLTVLMIKSLQSIKKGEECQIEMQGHTVKSDDKQLYDLLTAIPDSQYDIQQPLYFHLKLNKLIKIEDWFKDESTIVKTLRKGKGRNPYIDSTIKMRLQVLVNGQQILSNYPEYEPILIDGQEKNAQAEYDLFKSENLRTLNEQQRKEYFQKQDDSLYQVTLDSYTLPSLFIKIIKSMKKNGVCEVHTTRIDKLHTNFENEQIKFNQYIQIKEGDKIIFRITLLDSTHPIYFYKMKVQDKLRHVQRLKETATNFFKSQSITNSLKKAADIYQKINGYYNFGDASNNFAKEDTSSEEFIRDNSELQKIKLQSFTNLVVCKHKMQQWQSVIGITDQILSEQMDPNNIKAMYFRAYSLLKIEDFDQAVQCANNLLSLQSDHEEAKKLLQLIKKQRNEFRERESKKFGKMFMNTF